MSAAHIGICVAQRCGERRAHRGREIEQILDWPAVSATVASAARRQSAQELLPGAPSRDCRVSADARSTARRTARSVPSAATSEERVAMACAREPFDAPAFAAGVRARQQLFKCRNRRHMTDTGEPFEGRLRIRPLLVVAVLIQQRLHRIRVSQPAECLHRRPAYGASLELMFSNSAFPTWRTIHVRRYRLLVGTRPYRTGRIGASNAARPIASALTRAFRSLSARTSPPARAEGPDAPSAPAAPPRPRRQVAVRPLFDDEPDRFRREIGRSVNSDRSASMAASCTRSSESPSSVANRRGGFLGSRRLSVSESPEGAWRDPCA